MNKKLLLIALLGLQVAPITQTGKKRTVKKTGGKKIFSARSAKTAYEVQTSWEKMQRDEQRRQARQARAHRVSTRERQELETATAVIRAQEAREREAQAAVQAAAAPARPPAIRILQARPAESFVLRPGERVIRVAATPVHEDDSSIPFLIARAVRDERPVAPAAPRVVDNGNTELHRAALAGNVAEVQRLVASGVDVYAKNNADQTAYDIGTSDVKAALQIYFIAPPRTSRRARRKATRYEARPARGDENSGFYKQLRQEHPDIFGQDPADLSEDDSEEREDDNILLSTIKDRIFEAARARQTRPETAAERSERIAKQTEAGNLQNPNELFGATDSDED